MRFWKKLQLQQKSSILNTRAGARSRHAPGLIEFMTSTIEVKWLSNGVQGGTLWGGEIPRAQPHSQAKAKGRAAGLSSGNA